MALCAVMNGAVRNVASIEIQSKWRGLGQPKDVSLIIRHSGGRFSHEGRSIDGNLVQQLVDALEAGTLAAPDPLNLGLTPEMNRRLSDGVVADTPEYFQLRRTS
jgi:hypothetical protein